MPVVIIAEFKIIDVYHEDHQRFSLD